MELIIMIFHSSSRPIIKGKVGNKDAYFLLDTGTNLALIDSTQADEYNLEKGIEFSGNIIGTGGLGTKAYYCNTPVLLGDKSIKGFLLYDLNQIRNSIQRETGINILGIISYPQMKELGITINPSKNEIYGI